MSGGRSYIDPFEPAHIRRLVAEFGSPLLIVDCARVRRQYRKLQRALPGVDLHYALKPLPHAAVIDEGPVDEERRLFYVGITRAKERLCLSYAARSRRYGEIIANEPSRFLAELPQGDLHWDGRDAEQDDQSRRELASSHIARLANLLAD